MKRTFITNLILLVGLNLLVKPIYLLVVESEIQNRTGAEHFGEYFALINFSFILNILLDLGTTNWNTRRIAKDGRVTRGQFSRMIKLRLILALLYLIIAAVAGLLLHYSSWQMILLLILALNQVLVSMILYFRSYLMGLHLFRQDSVISVLDRFLLLLMMSVLLWGGLTVDQPFRIEWLIWGQTISYCATLIIAFSLVIIQGKKDRYQEEPMAISTILKESYPFALLILLSMIGYRLDAVILERISGGYEAGIYAMGFRFFEAVNMIAYLFAVLLLPIFTRMLNNKEDVTPLLQLSFKVLFTGTFILSTVCCFYSSEILTLIYDKNIVEAAPVFSWLMMSALFFSLQYITGTLITSSGNMKLLIWIALGGMISNISLNILYIPSMGSEGAARASCFTQALIFVAQTLVVLKQFFHGHVWKLGLQVAVFVSVTLAGGFFLTTQSFWTLHSFVSVGVFVTIAILAALATGMLDFKRLPELIKSRSATS